MAALAASKALATALADPDAPTARAEGVCRNAVYGAAAADIASAAGPCQACPARFEVTEEKEFAAELNSSASPDQAAEACSRGVEPAPRNIRKELISGGSTEKFTALTSVGPVARI